MEIPLGKNLILFDGYCHLCSRVVQLILNFDRKKSFLFLPMGSRAGRYWKAKWRIPESVNSVVLITNETFYIKSDAILQIAKCLGGFFNLLLIFRMIPKRGRDGIYDLVARNRFRWFGKRESCMFLPKEEDS